MTCQTVEKICNIGKWFNVPPLLCFLNEPLPEQRFSHAFQCAILAMQQVYFVVQAAENSSNGFLLSERGNFKRNFF